MLQVTQDEAGLSRKWIARINDAITRLEFAERGEALRKVRGLIDGTFGDKPSKMYVDLNDGLPAFEDIITSSLPDVPPPDVSFDFAQEIPCEKCAGTGGIPDPAGMMMPCEECGGDGQAKSLVDLKCEAYLRAIHKPHLGNVAESMERILWNEMSWGIGWGKIVWRRDVGKSRVSLKGADRDAQIEAAMIEAQGEPKPSEADNHAIHLEQHDTDIAEMMQADPANVMIDRLREHRQFHEEQLESATFQHPELQAIPSDRVVYDPFAERWRDCKWYAELVTERVADLKEVEGIKNLDRGNLPLNETEENERESLDNLPEDDALIDVWKIYDKQEGRWIWIPARAGAGGRGVNEYDSSILPVLDTDWPYPGNIYFALVVRHPGWAALHGLSSLVLCERVLKELARTNYYIRRHAEKHAAYKRLFPRGSLDKKAEASLADNESATGEIPTAAYAIMGQANNEMKPPPLPQVLLDYRDILLNALRKLLGSDNMATGASNPHQITASEAVAREGYHDARVKRRRDKIGEYLGQIGYGFLELFREWGRVGVPVMVNTPTGTRPSLLEPSDIPANFKVAYDVSSATEEAKAAKMQAKQNYYQMLLSVPGVGDARKIMEAWGKSIDEKDPLRLFADNPQQQPMMDPTGSMGGIPGGEQAQPGQGMAQPQLRIAGQ